MSLNLNYNFPPRTFITEIVEDIDLPQYNHVSKYGKDKDIEAVLIDHIFYKKNKYGRDIKDKYGRKTVESYGYIIYKQPFNINYDSSKYDEVPGILVYVKIDADTDDADVKRVLESSIIKNDAKLYAKQYINNIYKKQTLIPSVNSKMNKKLQMQFDPHTGKRLQKRFDSEMRYKSEPNEEDIVEAQKITKQNSIFNKEVTDSKHWSIPNPMPEKTKRAYFSSDLTKGGKQRHSQKKRKSKRRKYKKRKTRRRNKSKY